MPLSELEKFDQNPKLHDIGAIVASINDYGFKDPPKWEPSLNDGRGGIVEGNGRTESLVWMKSSGADAPRGIVDSGDDWLVPILVGVDAKSAIEAKAYALDHNNLSLMGGDMTALDIAGMYDRGAYLGLLIEIGNASEQDIVSVDGDDLDLLLSLGEDDGSDEGDEGSEEAYSSKITAPIYEPTGEKPLLSDLLDSSRFEGLIEEVEGADIDSKEKEFLRLAATRHIIFNFERIANYYAHSPEGIQRLMENSALVVVDFGRAMELGYIRMSKALKEIEKNAR